MNPPRFFTELKRRNVYKVAVAYAVVAWLCVQAASIVLPTFHAPEWTLQTIIALVAIGFPIALVIAWAFELTPQGIKRTVEVDARCGRDVRARTPRVQGHRAWIYIAVMGAALSLGLFFLGRYSRNSGEAARSEGASKSIAVLPFVNMGADKNDDYLSDGVSEELITALSRVNGLEVKARTSSFAFKGRNEDIQKIAEALHVSHLLEGSVAKSGDKLRITAQLIQATNGNHLWSDTYDREMQDIFAVRSEVAQQVVQTLKVKLGVKATQALTRKPTENLKAFQYYMQGRAVRQRRTAADIEAAIRFYQRALEEDAGYAGAYAGLADAYSAAGFLGVIAPVEARRQAEEAAHQALTLDPNLAEAYAALGEIHGQFAPSNFPLSEKELRRAMELSPSLAEGPENLGVCLVIQGRLDEASAQLEKACELDPVSSIMARALGLPYYIKRDYSRSYHLLKKANELGPSLSSTWEIGLYLKNGSLDYAFLEVEKAKAARQEDPLFIYSTGVAYAGAGRKAEALQVIKQLESIAGPNLRTAHWIAKIYAVLNDKEKALSWLERGLAAGAIGVFYKGEPIWDAIRDDPRFATFVRKTSVSESAEKGEGR